MRLSLSLRAIAGKRRTSGAIYTGEINPRQIKRSSAQSSLLVFLLCDPLSLHIFDILWYYYYRLLSPSKAYPQIYVSQLAWEVHISHTCTFTVQYWGWKNKSQGSNLLEKCQRWITTIGRTRINVSMPNGQTRNLLSTTNTIDYLSSSIDVIGINLPVRTQHCWWLTDNVLKIY